jgi:hypothetical protein
MCDVIGRRLVALPFTDACDPLVHSNDVWRLLLASLQSHNVPLQLRCLQDHIATADESFTIAKRARWHRLSIESSPELLWVGMANCNRRAIRSSERAGVEVRPLVGAEKVASAI